MLTAGLLVGSSTLLLPLTAHAADTPDSGFSLQVSPSPLVATIKPGQKTTLDLEIRNTSTASQALKMDLRSFTIDNASGEVKLGTSAPSEIAKFVSFASPTFSLQAGQLFNQHIVVDTPATAGFSYSFAITISQQNPPANQKGAASIRGSVAVFTLLNVDRPGATRKLNLAEFGATKHVFEYLPATLTVQFHNIGNTLVQPSGNIFIQRKSGDTKPLATIQVNPNGGYILPGSNRTLTTTWNDGLPHYVTTSTSGKESRKLEWSGGDITKLRFGRYTAKLVAVYNDGHSDVPLTAEITFWVIPWRLILVLLLIIIICIVGVVTILRKSGKAIKTTRQKHVRPKN
jgi:hypothetical protein